MRAIRTMKMLHALNMRKRDSGTESDSDTDTRDADADGDGETAKKSTAMPLQKGPFELDKHLSIFKSDSRFIIKRMDLQQGQHVEVSRYSE